MEDNIFDKVHEVDLKKTMETSYIDYAMSVIAARALPDVRDGLKPVQRRILYSMIELNNGPDKPHRKCARIVGDTMGKYHPHGDSSIYGALVNLAQEWSTRYPLVDGHGNFGSVDGDGAAAMRYTEARLSKISMEMTADINKDTVDFVPNFDETEKEPVVLPSRFPNLLVNGTSGIAVGMATNIPPHNLREVINAVVKIIDDQIDENGETSIEDILQIIKGPDFPTGAEILGTRGIEEAYRTGRGKIRVRAVTNIEPMQNGKNRIIVTELPFMVNKARLIEKIAELVRDKKVDGITDLSDQSSREGMRICIELRRDVNPNVILNQLYKHTQLQDTFGVIMLALVNNEPKVMNILDMLKYYLKHQEEVVTRRTIFFLKKAKIRAHILAGLMIALGSLDEVIELIKKSKTTDEARVGLMSRFGLDVDQANAILEMQLRRLTGLEQDKIKAEYEELKKKIAEYEAILADRQKVLNIIKEELTEDKEKYGDDRRTQIVPEADEMTIEDLTPNVPMAVFITRQGYLKRISLDTFERQNRATRGKGGIKTKEDDDVDQFFTAMMHDKVLFFSSKGTVYSSNVYEFPEGGRQAKGLPIINVLPLEQDEQITAVVPVSDFKSVSNLIMLTQKGYIKRISLDNFENIRKSGIIAIGLEDGDTLCWVKQAQDNDEVIIGTSCGMAIRFPISDMRPLGRSARGVNSMKLRAGDKLIGCDIVPRDYDADLLVVTSDGFGKRSKLSEFRPQNRGGIGLIATKFKSAASRLVALTIVEESDEIMVVTQNGVVSRIKADCISRQGRPATGVKIQNLMEGDTVCTINKIVDPDSDADENADCNLPAETQAEDNSVQQSMLGGLQPETGEESTEE